MVQLPAVIASSAEGAGREWHPVGRRVNLGWGPLGDTRATITLSSDQGRAAGMAGQPQPTRPSQKVVLHQRRASARTRERSRRKRPAKKVRPGALQGEARLCFVPWLLATVEVESPGSSVENVSDRGRRI